jgi:mono/diheme cytochrome c family protein
MIRFLSGFAAGALLLVLCVLGYLRFGLVEIRADVPVPRLMNRVLSLSTHAAVKRHAPELISPAPQSDETMIAGGKIYLDDCVGCHGEPGKPASAFGASFFPPAPQFFRVGTTFSESQVFAIAKHGIRRTGMGAQGDTYTDEKLWALTSFIKHLPNLPQSVSEGIQAKK